MGKNRRADLEDYLAWIDLNVGHYCRWSGTYIQRKRERPNHIGEAIQILHEDCKYDVALTKAILVSTAWVVLREKGALDSPSRKAQSVKAHRAAKEKRAKK